MSFIIGLTGSIGMGKSTTAAYFAEKDCAVWDADAAVHRLYEPGGAAVEPMCAAFPDAVNAGGVSRQALKVILRDRPDAFQQIEQIVHPLVAQDRAIFIEQAQSDIVVLDMPLLFEAGLDQAMDATVCVSTSAEIQKARVMARGQMSEQDFETILAKQMPDAEKRAKADYVVETHSIKAMQAQVSAILDEIRNRLNA